MSGTWPGSGGEYPHGGGSAQGYPPEGGYPQQGGRPPQGSYPQQGGGYPPPPPPGYRQAGQQGLLGGPPEQAWDAGGRGGSGAGPDGPRGGGGPSRKVVISTLVVTVLLAVLAGGLYGLLKPSKTVSPTPVAGSSTTPAPSSTAPTASASGTPSASASKTPTKSATPRQTQYVADPTGATGFDFGILKQVQSTASGYTITMDRAIFLTGTKAQDYYKQHPNEEPLDYAIQNANKKVRTFTVTKDAVVYAQLQLGDGTTVSNGTPITAQQFYEKSVQILATNGQLLLWLRHTDGADGPVYYIAEQYTP